MRLSAKASLTAVWQDAFFRAIAAIGDEAGMGQGDGQWMLNVPGAQIRVLLAEPAAASTALFIGTVSVQMDGEPQVTVVANLVSREDVGNVVWELARFSYATPSTPQGRPVLEPRRGAGPRALSLAALHDVLPVLNAQVTQQIVAHPWPLTPEALLTLLVEEVDEAAPSTVFDDSDVGDDRGA